MLELVPMVTEVVYQNMLWNLACHRRVFDMNYNESLLKALLERRGATTVLVRIAEAALDSELSFSERKELLTSLHALLECAGGGDRSCRRMRLPCRASQNSKRRRYRRIS
jgi:hypothetical protein